MEKEFITYTQSLALKELGFDEPCFAYYSINNIEESKLFFDIDPDDGELTSLNQNQFYHNNLSEVGRISAPLKQQAFEWFIDKHGLHIHMCPEFYKDGINYCWQILWYLPKDKWTDSNVHGGTMFYGDNHEYPTKEEAENACIDKMIEIVKNK